MVKTVGLLLRGVLTQRDRAGKASITARKGKLEGIFLGIIGMMARCQDVVGASGGTLCNRALRMALKECLQHSQESRGVLKQAGKQ